MPEPTTTRIQEWQRISLKLIVEGLYEKKLYNIFNMFTEIVNE